MAWLRLKWIQLYPYFNDILLLGELSRELQQSLQTTLQVFTRAGFIVDLRKSDLVPTQDLIYIGARFRMDQGRVYLLEDRIDGLPAIVRSFSKVGEF